MQCGLICAICVEHHTAGLNIVSTKCGHIFHQLCLNKWLEMSTTCPQCRKKVVKRSNSKLYFNFSPECLSDDKVNMLAEQLKKALSEIQEKDQKIKELQDDFAESDRNVAKMHQKQMALEQNLSAMKKKLSRLDQLEATNQKLLDQNSTLENDVQRLLVVKGVVGGSYDDTVKIVNDIIASVSTKKGKSAVQEIGDFCCDMKEELNGVTKENGMLRFELSESRREIRELQADLKRANRGLGYCAKPPTSTYRKLLDSARRAKQFLNNNNGCVASVGQRGYLFKCTGRTQVVSTGGSAYRKYMERKEKLLKNKQMLSAKKACIK